MAGEFARWLKIGQDLNFTGDELRGFVKERQEECRIQRIDETESEDRRRQVELELKRNERELKREESEREAVFKREEREATLKREEREATLKREEREATLKREEMEMNLTKIELDHQREIRLKEIEFRVQIENRKEVRMVNGFHRGETHTHDNTKAIKMPVYRSEIDCLDSFLLRYERLCMAYEVRRELCSLTLTRFLQGKALDVYERMNVEDSQDYEKFKEELLRRFKLTEGGYNKKFKQERREKDETASQFCDRLKRYLQMSGHKNDYEGLESLILKDQFFTTCDDDLRCFLKEKEKLSLNDMLVQAQNFIEARETSEKRWYPEWKV